MSDCALPGSVAYAAERVRARRLARQTGLTQAQALQQILITVAAPSTLEALVAQRQAERTRAAARLALREHNKLLTRTKKSAFLPAEGAVWLAWFDGSALPNPGRIGLGGVLQSPQAQRYNFSLRSDYGDSSQAEYLALLGVLELALQHNASPLIICGDSKVVLDDLVALHGIGRLAPYRMRARALLAQIGQVRSEWIPRHKNAAADLLAQRARDVTDAPFF